MHVVVTVILGRVIKRNCYSYCVKFRCQEMTSESRPIIINLCWSDW
jgi:hypothetical protein